MRHSFRKATRLFCNTLVAALSIVVQAGEMSTAERQIENLLIHYAHATDALTRGDADRRATLDAYQAIFTDAATIGLKDQMSFPSAEAWLDFVAASSVGLADSQHLIGSQRVGWTESSEHDASLTSYLQATRIADNGAVSRVVGTYRARAVLENDTWQLDELILDLMVMD